ncbi:hypothetical protein [Paraburkholderia tropica]|uniref:hypothetical protein n=1 Tax=Paraburkholderia tropica TaxID=92647 RepID=UPI001F1B7D1A|nr:hypothetical protein [Paraburkholderia tropica]
MAEIVDDQGDHVEFLKLAGSCPMQIVHLPDVAPNGNTLTPAIPATAKPHRRTPMIANRRRLQAQRARRQH